MNAMQRIVMYSPLPPCKSGIGAYTAELLPTLTRMVGVTLVCQADPDEQEVDELLLACAELEVIPWPLYQPTPQQQALPHYFQIGNNKDHVFVYDAFRQRPEYLVQHDFNLHYLVEDATLARGDAAAYKAVLREEYGDAGAMLADLRDIGVFSETQKHTLPVNRHLVAIAKGVIVHNQWVYDKLPAAIRPRAVNVPHHYSPLADQFRTLGAPEARTILGLPHDVPLILSLGFVTPPKRIHSTLSALGLLKREGKRFKFVIAGERNPSFDIDEHIARNDLADDVIVTGYVSETDFFRYIRAADLLVNLRYPTVGESSGTLARALALGLPSIVYDFGPFSEFPDHVVHKVPLEKGEPVQLAAAIRRLLADESHARSMSLAAIDHMAHHCTVELSCESYLRLPRLETAT
jgi:glycosyltransferase involved in cell wall biosynthesis